MRRETAARPSTSTTTLAHVTRKTTSLRRE
jgi:hypothetical protein